MRVRNLLGIGLLAAGLAAAEPNVIRDGDFERGDLTFAQSDAVGAWRVFRHGKSDARAEVVAGEGRGGSRGVRYSRTAPGSDNFHLDQMVEVEGNALYEVSAWTRADGRLNPLFAVMAENWRVLTTVPSNAGTNWTRVGFLFRAPASGGRVRLEWFPGTTGPLYEGAAGTGWLDDVAVRRLAQTPPELARALELTRSHEGETLDVSAVKRGAVGRSPLADAQPLLRQGYEGQAARPLMMPVICRGGVLLYTNGTEVALWGVNFQTALSWEYNARLKNVGVPLEIGALKEIADRNLDGLVRMRASVIRMHLLPSDFTDADGNVVDSLYLDALDYTVAGCRKRGIYVYLTLLNEMGNTVFMKDSFMAGRDRREWITDPALVEKECRDVRALLTRENRYTGTPYQDEAAIAVVEIANEPGYADYVDLGSEPLFAGYRKAFETWCAEKGYADNPNLHYSEFRYETVRAYIDRLCAAVRGAGSAKSVVWNLNWPKMVGGREDVFQAAADSSADGVSFCLYPGQHDVKHPYWSNPADLSGRNYLPFLKASHDEYERLGWALGKRFEKKAKLVYEYETFFNQSSYLYPAMARVFRALGVQIANMWTYSLTPAAERMAGSHHLNLYCTPQKAASFAIAGEVMAETPRYAPLAWARDDNLAFGSCAVSFINNLSVWRSADTYMQSRASALEMGAPVASVRHVLACGRSPYADYDGTGLYTIEIGADAVDVEINPDAEFIWPPWKGNRKAPWDVVTKLDAATPHRFVLRHPAWQTAVRVWRVENGQRTPVACDSGAPAFEARPGCYRIER